jgi:hypothetical protein
MLGGEGRVFKTLKTDFSRDLKITVGPGALIAIVAPTRWPKIAPSLAAFTLILAIGLLCIGGVDYGGQALP